jgi:predicted dehydrogenase
VEAPFPKTTDKEAIKKKEHTMSSLISSNQSSASVLSPYWSPRRDHLSASFKKVDHLDATKILRRDGKLIVPSYSMLTPELLSTLRDGGNLFLFGSLESESTRIGDIELNLETLPKSEWYLKLNKDIPAFVRFPSEVPILSSLYTCRTPEGAEPLTYVNIHMQDRLVSWRRAVGAGTLHFFGFDFDSLTCANEEVRYLVEVYLTLSNNRPKPFGVSVVGYGPYGGMGYFHGSAASSIEGLSFVGAVDPSPDRRAAASREFPGITTVSTHKDLLEVDEVEVVVVATPPSTHYQIALDALRAGRHVVLEKPMCLTVQEADELIELAQAQGLVLTVNQNRRWDQDYRAIREVVFAGGIGDLFNIETFVGTFDHPCRAWHSDEGVSGGAAYDWGAHYVDWTLQLLGQAPTVVTSFGHKRRWYEVSNLDQITIHMSFPEGREATFIQSDLAAIRKPKFYLQGTEGTLVGHYQPITKETVTQEHGYVKDYYHFAEAPAELELARYEGPNRVSRQTITLPPPKRYGFWRNFADHIHLGSALEVQPDQVREVIAVLEQAHLQSKDG